MRKVRLPVWPHLELSREMDEWSDSEDEWVTEERWDECREDRIDDRWDLREDLADRCTSEGRAERMLDACEREGSLNARSSCEYDINLTLEDKLDYFQGSKLYMKFSRMTNLNFNSNCAEPAVRSSCTFGEGGPGEYGCGG